MIKLFLAYILLISIQLNASIIAFYNDFSANLASTKSLISDLKKEHTVYVADNAEQFERVFMLHSNIDIAILALQDEPISSTSFPSFSSFVKTGGKVIFADGNRGSSWETLFGFRYSGNTNMDTVLFSNAGFESMLDALTQTLHNPGYVTYAMGLVPQSNVLATFENGDAASLLLNDHIIINGFLLDTDKVYATAVARAAARTPTGSVLLAQVAALNDPSSVSSQNSQAQAGATQVYGVPLEKHLSIMFALLLAFASVLVLYKRRAF